MAWVFQGLPNFTLEHKGANSGLSACLAGHSPGLSAYEFLSRTSFNTTDDYDLLENSLRERLRYMATNEDRAFDAIDSQLSDRGALCQLRESRW
jgi:hypothetical protein